MIYCLQMRNGNQQHGEEKMKADERVNVICRRKNGNVVIDGTTYDLPYSSAILRVKLPNASYYSVEITSRESGKKESHTIK